MSTSTRLKVLSLVQAISGLTTIVFLLVMVGEMFGLVEFIDGLTAMMSFAAFGFMAAFCSEAKKRIILESKS